MRREAILTAAMEVLARGYHAGLVEEVAQRAEAAEAMLWYHFRSKAGFVVAVLQRRDELALDAWVPVVDDPVAGLRAVLPFAVFTASIPGAIALQAAALADCSELVRGYHQERQAFLAQRFEQLFGDCRARGLLADGVEPARAARAAVALMDGLQVQRLVDREVDVARELAFHLRALMSEEARVNFNDQTS